MIRIDAIWLSTDPMDMRAGTDTALARVIAVSVRRSCTVLIYSPTAAPLA
ncbi:hypothetical protein SAMN05428951_101505 [Pseudomonas sp. OV546]|nr:hypothetical protein SAMN05428951_101505 [Pseudomonas sp. OV546]